MSAGRHAGAPNILYLHTHDTGRFVQPYGHAVPTPRLQQFATEGVVFRRAFAAAPTCSPSRAALLTGQAPHSAGMYGLAHRGWRLHDHRQHLVHTLAGAGYRSAMVGQQHVAAGPREGEAIGYDEHLTTDGVLAASVVPPAVAYLRREHSMPFFLSVGLFETHARPTGGSTFGYPPEDDRYVAPPPTMPDTPTTRRDMASFHASLRVMDTAVGEILDALDDAGLAERTLVIITTDHGVALPGMKCTLSDLGTGVMLMLRGPGPFTGGRVCDALVSQVDLFPTICDVAGIDAPPWLQGRSFLPALDGGTEVNEAVFSEITYHASYQPQRSVREQRWKYVRHFGDRRHPVLTNVDASPSKDLWVASGWGGHEVPHEELYDLTFDPHERQNLAGHPALSEVLDRLRTRLAEWMDRTSDPLLHGPVPEPEGGVHVDPDAVPATAPTEDRTPTT